MEIWEGYKDGDYDGDEDGEGDRDMVLSRDREGDEEGG
jgi:hypothetical protein